MPSRWWIPLRDARPDRVRPEHTHAAISRWFDPDTAAHYAPVKRYAISPLVTDSDGESGCEVALLERALLGTPGVEREGTPDPLDQLRRNTRPGSSIRLGTNRVSVGTPRRIAGESWESLATPSGSRSWELEFVTPVTFRRRDRSSPLPAPPTLLRGLLDSWNYCSGLPVREIDRSTHDLIWVSDIAGNSAPMKLSGFTVSGFTGRVTYRCDDAAVADIIDGLFRLAPYSGCGSARAKGLGVTRLTLPERRCTRAAR